MRLDDDHNWNALTRAWRWIRIDVELLQYLPGPQVFAEDPDRVDALALRLDRFGVLFGPAAGLLFVAQRLLDGEVRRAVFGDAALRQGVPERVFDKPSNVQPTLTGLRQKRFVDLDIQLGLAHRRRLTRKGASVTQGAWISRG